MMATQENGKNVEVYTMASKSEVQKTAETKQKFWHIDREMLRFKLHYFLFMGGLGSLYPYITIFAKNRIHISASSMGSILTTQQFLFIFTRPVIGYIADYFNKLKAIICILTVVQTIFYFLLLAIPRIQKAEEQTIYHNNTPFLDSYEHLISSDFYVNCPSKKNITPSEADLFLKSREESEICIPSSDNLSKFYDECSNQDGIVNVSGLSVLNITTDNFLFPEEKANKSSIISLYSHFLSDCKLCCESTRKCKNFQCKIPNDEKMAVASGRKFVSDFETYQFWLFALLTTIAMGCTNSLFTLSDTACAESVEKFGSQFGRQRLFGAIGWGLISPIGGLLNDYTNDFTASWILMAVISLVSIVNILRLDLVKTQFSRNLMKDIGLVLRSKEFLAFELLVFLNGVCTGIYWYYLVWYLTVIGASRLLCGLVNTVECFVGEIPCFFFALWVIKKIGHFNVLTLSLMCYCVRFFWYSQLWNPWLVLLTEGLSGITYGFFYAAVASYAKLSAKPGTEATTQAVLVTTHEGLGAGIGCVVAGLGFDTLGGSSTFFYLGVFAGCGMILSVILHLIIRGSKGSFDVTSYQST